MKLFNAVKSAIQRRRELRHAVRVIKTERDQASIIAFAGDIVTCENGHRLYRITSDVLTGSLLRSVQFEAIHPSVSKPLPQTLMRACPECGRRWFRQGLRGVPWCAIVTFSVHFDDGWRPSIRL